MWIINSAVGRLPSYLHKSYWEHVFNNLFRESKVTAGFCMWVISFAVHILSCCLHKNSQGMFSTKVTSGIFSNNSSSPFSKLSRYLYLVYQVCNVFINIIFIQKLSGQLFSQVKSYRSVYTWIIRSVVRILPCYFTQKLTSADQQLHFDLINKAPPQVFHGVQ